jgi:hypothetical protein
MDHHTEIEHIKEIEQYIFTLRGVAVMLDRDLAAMYQVDTKVLNQSVKRNLNRFPDHWRFQLTNLELIELVTNCDRLSLLKHSSANPYAFTEQGVAMLATTLRSPVAVNVSISIMSAFVEMRRLLTRNSNIITRITNLEYKQSETDIKFEKVFNALEARSDAPAQGIFFEGQIFDAWLFVSGLIQSAEQSIELWDHYIDASVLMLLSKRKPDVHACIYLKKISPALRTDIEKHHAQYAEIHFEISTNAHDRFLLIDNTRLFHIGASLKDLGKRCFAFSILHEKFITDFRKKISSDNSS